MLLQKDAFEDINKIFILPSPINLVDKESILRTMDSFYELEDYIKEKIYDKKYPGVLPNIDPNMISRGESSDEEEEQNQGEQEQEQTQNKNSQTFKPVEKK